MIAGALAASRQQGAVGSLDVATVAEEAVGEPVELGQPRDVDTGRTSAERSVERMQDGAVDQRAAAPCGGRTEGEEVEEWMWNWTEWRRVAPGEPCPAGMVFSKDLALMYEDDAEPDICIGMDVDAAETPLLPMPTAVPPPPLRSCEQWLCRFHAAGDVHQDRLTSEGRREAMLLVGALERYQLQAPGRVARDRSLEAVPLEDDRVSCVQQVDAAVLDHHPGEVQLAEPPEHLLLSVRLSVGCMLDEAGLEDVHWDGLYMALWRSGADAWRHGLRMRPLTPQTMGSHAVLVAMHPEGMEAVFGEDGTNYLSLAVDNAVLVPISSSYRLVSRGGDPRLLVVVGTHQGADMGHGAPEQCAVKVEEDEAVGAWVGHEGGTAEGDTEGPTAEGGQEERGPDPGPSEVDE